VGAKVERLGTFHSELEAARAYAYAAASLVRRPPIGGNHALPPPRIQDHPGR
jgi:hypothetical protein